MSLLIVFVTTILGMILGKMIFKNWVNHLTMYSIIMGGLTFLYELKLLAYPDIIPLAWFFLFASFLSFVLGIITFLSAKNLNPKWSLNLPKTDLSLPIFADKGKMLKYSVIFFSLIGLFVALQRWYVLIGMFGSIEAVLLKAAVIYRMNVNGEIKEFIPILPAFIYVGVFLSGVYTAYRGKFSFLSFFPILCIILKELTYFGRGEMFFSTMQFLVTFFLFRSLLNTDKKKRFKFSIKNATFAAVLLVILLITAASVVRTFRGVNEKFSGTSGQLKSMQENVILTPSVYLYLSSDVGVFSKYLELEKEFANFGQNSFRLVYDILASLKLAEKPSFFQKGYYIPMWTNTGTYIRELHADFGTTGVLLVPYLLGLIITWLWFKFHENKSLFTLVFLVYLYIIIGFTFLMMVTRLNQWFFSQFLTLLFLPILNRLSIRNSKVKLTTNS